MFCFYELHFLLVGLFNLGSIKTSFVGIPEKWQNQNDFALAGYRNDKCYWPTPSIEAIRQYSLKVMCIWSIDFE